MGSEPPPPPSRRDHLLRLISPLMNGQTFVTVTTLVISLALAYATFVQADAARKSQISQTWPYISFGTSNTAEDGKPEISLDLINDGVGPARLEQMELLYQGRAMNNPREFLNNCCSGPERVSFMSSPVGGVLRPGERRQFIRLARTDANSAVWDKLNLERWNIVIRSCYCSIFDDCWVVESRFNMQLKGPDAVAACPAGWSTFDERPVPAKRPIR